LPANLPDLQAKQFSDILLTGFNISKRVPYLLMCRYTGY